MWGKRGGARCSEAGLPRPAIAIGPPRLSGRGADGHAQSTSARWPVSRSVSIRPSTPDADGWPSRDRPPSPLTAIWLSRQRAGGRRGRRAAIATLGLSGLRAHEVAGLRRRHLDFTHGRIVIEDGKIHGSVREVHISPFLREELLVYVADLKLVGADDLLFPTKARPT